MKLYTFYTPSHEELLQEWVLPYLPADLEPVVKNYDQVGPIKEQFGTESFNRTTMFKAELILEAICENPGEVFLYADVDVQFFAPVSELIIKTIKNKDMSIQRDSIMGDCCTGIIAIRGNEANKNLWENIRHELKVKNDRNDQQVFNDEMLYEMRSARLVRRFGLDKYVPIPNKYQIKWNYLPEQFFTYGFCRDKWWSVEDDVYPLPKDIVMHHANYCIGVEEKIKQLRHVRKLVEANRK